MTNTPDNQLADLLIQQSIFGLSNEEQQQLDDLRRENNLSDSELQNEIERLELSAASADLACFQNETAVMPDHLKDCVLVEAGKFFESQASSSNTEEVAGSVLAPKAAHPESKTNPWLIATVISTAASILLLLNVVNFGSFGSEISIAAQFDQFVASSPVDLQDLKMVAGFDATGSGITDGRLVWSDELQTGFMQFPGLKTNDPKVEQYQLWIFNDAGQKYPVDGGVFDINSNNDIIKIDPKIAVDAKYFAVTVEQPGGVVVSDRTRIASGDEDLVNALLAASK